MIRRGIISKRAIKKFLARSRRDFRPWLNLSEKRLEKLVQTLPIQPPIWSKLRRVQKCCLIIGARTKRFAFFNDTGTGKTYLAIALAQYFRKLGLVKQVLVLVPNRINRTEWGLEIEKLSPETSFCILTGSTRHKWQQLAESRDLLVIDTYPGIVRMLTRKEQKKRSKKMRLVPDRKAVEKFAKQFQGLITDEGTVLGNFHSLPFRICRKLLKTTPFFCNLTATPFGRDPSLLWSQMYLVDNGHSLGETVGLFRAAFYREQMTPWGGIDFIFRKRKKPLLRELISHASISFPANKADLPRVVPIRKEVSLPEDAETYYEKAKAKLIASHGNYKEMKNAFLRMRQISSGFVGYEDDETGARAQFEFDENPKMEMLLSVCQSIDPKYKSIIFYEFTYSGLRIVKELEKLDIGCTILYGGTKDVEKPRRTFNNDPSVQFLILQNQFGIGLNLQVAKYGLFYESPVSAIKRKQCNRRVERQYSEHERVFLYDFLTRGTVDSQILDFHKEGEDLFQALLRGGMEGGRQNPNKSGGKSL